jgi:hypothetical protein
MNDLTYAGETPDVLAETSSLYAVWLHSGTDHWRVLRLSTIPNSSPFWCCVAIADSHSDAVSLAVSLFQQER